MERQGAMTGRALGLREPAPACDTEPKPRMGTREEQRALAADGVKRGHGFLQKQNPLSTQLGNTGAGYVYSNT